MVHCRLLSKKLSQLDLTVEPVIGRKLVALGIFDNILVDHFDLARGEGVTYPYDPYAEVAEETKAQAPDRYAYQGLVRGEVEQLLSAMSKTKETAGSPLEWYEFENGLKEANSDLFNAYKPVQALLINFHPSTHPIVWRALIAFFLLSKFYTHASRYTVDEYDNICQSIRWQRLDYREHVDQSAEDHGNPLKHYEAAQRYLRAELTSEYETLKLAGTARAAEQLASD